jgi:hypothetical protein
VQNALARTLVVALTAVTLVGCSSAAEQTILNEFFAASRLRDKTALRNVATVSFEPDVQGIITGFAIMKVTAAPTSGDGVRSEEVSISAPVKLPGGQTLQKNFVITMQRAPREGGRRRWFIVSIRDVPAAPSTPRS